MHKFFKWFLMSISEDIYIYSLICHYHSQISTDVMTGFSETASVHKYARLDNQDVLCSPFSIIWKCNISSDYSINCRLYILTKLGCFE
jgi:hypothetical protein